MLKLRKEAFGAIFFDSTTGNIVQLNNAAAAIVEKYLQDKKNISPTEQDFMALPVFESMFAGKDTKYSIIDPEDKPRNFLAAPESINVRLTQRCNMTCEGCYESRSNTHTEDMSADLLSKIIDYADTYGVCRLQFGGGEPFLYDQIFDAIKQANERGIFVSVGTNGSLLSEKVIEKCKESGCGHIQLSLTNPIISKKTDVDSFANTAKALAKNDIKFGFNIILTKSIMHSLLTLVDEVQQLLPNNINILRAKPSATNAAWYEAEKSNGISEECKTLLYELQRLHKNLHLDCSLAEFRIEKNIGCLAGSRSMTILPDGTVLPCPFMSDYCIPNQSHNQGLNEMWLHSPELNHYRSLLGELSEKKGVPLYTLRKCMLFT